MASAIDLSSLTMNNEEARDFVEVVFEKLYGDDGRISAANDIHTGVQMGTQIPFFGVAGMIGKASSGCTPNAVSGVAVTQKLWEPKLFDARLTHCQNDISQLFKLWKRSPSGLATWEDVDNEQMAFLASMVVNSMVEAILRLTALGDTNASPVGDATGDELLTSGTTKAYFNLFDGYWPQIIDAVTGSLTTRYTITENGLGSKAAQIVLAADRGLKTLRYLYNNADARLMAAENKVFVLTHSLFTNWVDYLEDQSLGFMLQQTEEGSTKWLYRGIPIIVRPDWDRNIRAYWDNGTTYYFPHRAYLSTKANIPIGTSDEGDFTNFDAFYDRTDKQHYMDVASYLDAKMLEPYMVIAAY